MGQLDGRVALVTGSTRGIGAAVARRLALAGARVAIHGRDADAAAIVHAEIEAAGGKAIATIADITSFADIEEMRREIEETLGPVDILVCNAGHNPVPPAPLEEIPEEGFRASLELNLTGTFLTLKSFLPGMKQRRRGSIVTVSSAAARRPHPNSPMGYAAAKAGIILLTQELAAQAGPFNIRANCIAPETILTENNLHRIAPELQASMAKGHPIQRLGTPEDVAEAALFLASDASGWITGTVLDIAGGAVLA